MDNKQRKALKAKAHKLKPVVMIGQHGLTDPVQHEIDIALTAHELIKIRISGSDGEQRQAMVEQICSVNEATHVASIGHIAIVYRKKVS